MGGWRGGDGGDKRKGTQIQDARLVVGCWLDISHGDWGGRDGGRQQINLQYHLHTPVQRVIFVVVPGWRHLISSPVILDLAVSTVYLTSHLSSVPPS